MCCYEISVQDRYQLRRMRTSRYPYLDANNEIKHWHVDFNGPDKILTVETESLSDEMIRQIVKKAGYKAEPLNQ